MKPCVTLPAEGAWLSGPQTVSVVVTITGTNPGISKLIFYLNGEYLLTDFQSPYTFTLPTAKWVDGVKTLAVEVLMKDGFTSQRSSVQFTFNNGVTQTPVNNNTFTPTNGITPAPGQPFVLAAAGDGAGGLSQADSVTTMVDSWNPNLFVYLGDVYEKGTPTEFYNWYGTPDAYYGRFRDVTNPIIGNHEYEQGVAPGYFDYWNNPPNYYSYDAAGWHFIALNSNCGLLQNCAPGQAQYQWLLNDLNTHPNTCTIAYFHHPIYNVGPQGPDTRLNDMWALMAQKGVDIVLAGHDHNYQRWVPLNGSGQPSATGITQFVAGGGGHGIQNFVTTDSRLAAGFDTSPNSLGALKFVLNPHGASFQYVNYLSEVLDSGAIRCSGAPLDSTAPSVPANLTVLAESSTQADLTWDASSDNVGVAGYDIYRDGSLLASLGVVNTYHDVNLPQGGTYTYQVRARDGAGNVSSLSSSATITMPALLFSDGFESGDFSAWTTVTNLLIQQQDIYGGLYAARQSSSGAGASHASKTLSPAYTDLYYSLRFKVISNGPNSAYLQRFRTGTNSSIGGVFITSTNRLAYRNDVAGASNTTGPTVTLGVWHELQTHLVINGTSSLIEVWYDGELIPSLSLTENFGTNPIGRIQLGDNSTTNSYNIALDEVGVNTSFIEVDDTQPPSVPTWGTAAASAPHIVNLTWNASSDDGGLAGYEIYRNGALLASTGAATTYTDSPVSPSFTYHYQIQARDLAGNLSARSTIASVTTPADTTPPSVSLTEPPNGSTVNGDVLISASASDNAMIKRVEFLVNGQVVGSVEEPPYAVFWESTTVPDGQITVAARAVDIALNTTTSSSRTLVVNNSVTPTPTRTPIPVNTPTSLPPTSICLSASQDSFMLLDKPSQNHGSDSELKLRPDWSNQRRILIGFDLSSVPPTSTVTDASLRIYQTAKQDGQTVNLYRLTNSWVESQVSWTNRDSSTRWMTGGGEYNGTTVASFVPNVDNQYREISITSLAQGWVNGTFDNYGVLLRSSGSSGEVKFESREALSSSRRPQLCLTYQQTPLTTPTVPSGTTATPGGTSATPTTTPVNTATSQPPTSVCLAPSQDSFLVQDAASRNEGGNSELKIKPDSGKERRILIGFDLTSIPQSSTVLSSTLRLYETTTKDNQTVSLYRLTNSWTESQVTWDHRSSGSTWAAGGGDYQNTALATFAPNLASRYRELNVTAVTQSWVTGTFSNHGFLLRSTGANGEVKFVSREGSSSSQRPQLCVTYQRVPTITPTSPPTHTPVSTAAGTATGTATNTPPAAMSPTATLVPVGTATATPTFNTSESTFIFTPAADAYVNEASPAANYGGITTLRADASPVVRSYLRFTVQGLSGSVTRVSLRVLANSNSSLGYEVRPVSDNTWSEFALNYGNAPVVGDVSGSSGSMVAGTWTTVDITPLITGNGTFSLALTTASNTAFSLASRESGASAPQLVIETNHGPTSTPSATLVPTHTATFTASPTFGPSPTATHTLTATHTVTATPLVTSFSFNPAADAYVNEASPTSNYGSATTLRADASPLVRSYLRFDVQGVSGTVTRVTLRIFSNSGSSAGYEVRNVLDNTWSEGTINHGNAPAMEPVTAGSGAFGASAWTSVDVTSLVTGNGTYNLALTTTSSTAFSLASRESGASAPQLVIEIAP